MLFVSYEFIAFTSIVVLLYYSVFKKYQWQFLLFSSYIFYLFADVRYLIYMMAQTVILYVSARKIGEDERNPKKKKIWFFIGLFSLLGGLFFLKYADFFLDSITNLRIESYFLPMGLSFYTFKGVSYLIDVYRKKYTAEKNLGKVALYISFFPEIPQGPISRYNNMTKSLYSAHSFSKQVLLSGLLRVSYGYFKKVVIADRIMVAVVKIISEPSVYKGSFSLLLMLFYAIQIYADFTGGIDITIGIAEMLGIRVLENFKRPYFSKSVREYWTRWHISMGTWFSEYVFYPVSLSTPMLKISQITRKYIGRLNSKKLAAYLSTMVVWFLTGLWHGANWTFVVWGLLNGVIMIGSDILQGIIRKRFPKAKVGETCNIKKSLLIIRTIMIMSFLRLLDCYNEVGIAFNSFCSIFFADNWREIFEINLGLDFKDYMIVLLGVIFILIVSLLDRKEDVRVTMFKKDSYLVLLTTVLIILVTVIFGAYGRGYSSSQFIYNRF